MQLLIATQNQNKVDRIRNIFDTLGCSIKLLSISGFDIPEPDEPYDSFAENAFHKANYYCKATGYVTLSEDSGLCINALNRFPGVRTKEFMVDSGGIHAACADLQSRLKDSQDLSAYFICAACIVFPDTQDNIQTEGVLTGTISLEPFKDQGFAFERIFIPEVYTNTMAELSLDDIMTTNHRYKAIKNIYQLLSKTL